MEEISGGRIHQRDTRVQILKEKE